MASSKVRRLVRLMLAKGYELVETTVFGDDIYRLAGCTDVRVTPKVHPGVLVALTRQVERETRNRDPEDTNAARAKQLEWEREEADRLARVQADVDRNKNRRLGGLSAVLTEKQVDQVARRAERILADRRATDRLMRARPLT